MKFFTKDSIKNIPTDVAIIGFSLFEKICYMEREYFIELLKLYGLPYKLFKVNKDHKYIMPMIHVSNLSELASNPSYHFVQHIIDKFITHIIIDESHRDSLDEFLVYN